MTDSLTTDLNTRIVTDPVVENLGLNALRLMINPEWLRNTLRFIWIFRKHSLKPAIFFTAGEVCAILSLYLSWSDLLNRGAEQSIPGNEVIFIFIKMIIIMIIFGGAALILTSIGVGLWVLALTGFCRSFLTDFKGLNLSEDEVQNYQKECIDQFKTRKSYLFVVWIVYSIIMAIPFAIF